MDVTTWVIIGIVSMLVSALFSGCEMAYVTSDRVRVEIDVKQGGVMPIPNSSYPRYWLAIISSL